MVAQILRDDRILRANPKRRTAGGIDGVVGVSEVYGVVQDVGLVVPTRFMG
jgi:hypothetical protein